MSIRRWLTAEQEQAWVAYLTLSRRLAAGMERQLAGSGVSGADYQVLVPLSDAGVAGMRPRDIARSAGWSRSRLAHQLRRLEARGLVTRDECSDDGRGTVVRLAKSGRDALRRASPGHLGWVREHFIDVLTPAEMTMLVDLSRRVVSGLADEDG